MPRGKAVSFKTADGKTVSFRANPRGRRSSRAEFRAEHVARKPRGWRVRTVRPGDGRHQVRIAFPPGPRRTGAGRVLEILHPRGENPKCDITPATAGGIAETVLQTQKRNPGPGELVVLGLGNPKRKPGAPRRVPIKRQLRKMGISIPESASQDIRALRSLRSKTLGNPEPKVTTYRLVSGITGRHIRKATKVVFPDGKEVRFLDRIPKKQAIPAALKQLRQNPNHIEQAADLYREFHGKEPGELLKIQQTAELRKDYAALGPLLSLRGCVGSSRWEITFDRDKPMLASSPDGHQLYILGGDQNIDACLGQMETDAERDFVDLGTVKQIVYFARKAAGNFEPIEWEHDFEDPLPRAHYDRLNQRIAITGGAYYIEAPGIID